MAENTLRKHKYTGKGMTFAAPEVERVYTAPGKVCSTVTLTTCSAGGMILGITCQGENGGQLLELARKKMNLKPVDRAGEAGEGHYEKIYAGDVRLTLRTSKDQGVLILRSPEAVRQCQRLVPEAQKSLEEKNAAARTARSQAGGADF